MNKIAKQSPDLLQELIQKLKDLYPSLFNDEKNLNEDELRNIMSNFSSKTEGKYEFNWAGKMNAKRLAFAPSRAMLKPDRKRSNNFDKTENIIIEGDNFEVLKLLQRSYTNSIKCIYIDPPYNTGKDRLYMDDFSIEKKPYWEQSGTSEGGVIIDTNTDSRGRYHSEWLNFMYSRLQLAWILLKRDGVIFISIDDHELYNLKKLVDEIFGEENFVANIVWKKRGGGGSDNKYFATEYEYILCYIKDQEDLPSFTIEYSEQEKLRFNQVDENGKYYLKTLIRPERLGSRPNLQYQITDPDGKIIEKTSEGKKITWVVGETKFEKMKLNNEIVFQKNRNGNYSVYRKVYMKNRVPSSLFTDIALNRDATAEIQDLFPGTINLFPNPKPSKLIKHLLRIADLKKNDIFLDFFAGSGTSAHALYELNSGGTINGNFILVQLPEKTDEGSEAFNLGYKTISGLCIERVKRVSEKLKKAKVEGVDLGFKVFTLTKSLFPENQFISDPEKTQEENKLAFEKYLQNVNKQLDFTYDETELMYEVLLKDGFKLNFSATKVSEFEKNTVYKVSDGEKTALLCIDANLHENTLQKLQEFTDQRLLCLERAVDTTKKWNLKNMFGDNLWVI